MSASKLRSVVRVCFVLYAIALTLGTHWPQLSFDVGIPRTDIWLHITAFAGWTLLLIACSFFGPAISQRNLSRAVCIAVVYAAIDESTQAIPVLHRHVGLDDFLANVGGVLSAVLIVLVYARARKTALADAGGAAQAGWSEKNEPESR